MKILSIKGFNLIELLITIFLISIFLTIAVPNFQHLVIENRVDTHVQQLVAAIQFARTEAIKRGENVIFCKSNNSLTCGGQWNNGQIVLVNQVVIRVFPTLPKGDDLKLFGSFGKNEQLEFLPQGFTNGQQGSIYYCPTEKEYGMRIVIEQTGRIRLEKNGSKC
jgi:type IV fimbrial biogenesis protein FimT